MANESKGSEKIISMVWETINIYDGPEIFLESYRAAGEAAASVYAAIWIVEETRNGGLWQLFYNSTGILVPEGIEGFRRIGMPLTADSLENVAKSVFGEEYPRARAIRQAQMPDREWPEWTPLGQRFYDLIETENAGIEAAVNIFAERL